MILLIDHNPLPLFPHSLSYLFFIEKYQSGNLGKSLKQIKKRSYIYNKIIHLPKSVLYFELDEVYIIYIELMSKSTPKVLISSKTIFFSFCEILFKINPKVPKCSKFYLNH